ncbi:MAG: metal ABC transporter substrate-binding protein, partial [Chloroflexota bacterium]|nr:metal ABC transporter substrate-binding protein [Chloroflexota bacterium]
EGDPHVWFDPTNAQTMVTNITSGLAKVDPANATVYQANAKAYTDQLTQLDEQLKGIFEQVPKAQRKLVTNHDAFRYLAQRYDLTIVGAVIPSISDTAEPSAKQVSDLIDTIKKEKVKAIFAESSANPKVAQQVAKETGIAIVDTLYGDTLGEPGSTGDTYIKMMTYDATTITNAIK